MSLRAAERLLDASDRVVRIARADFHTVREQPWNSEAGASMTAMMKRRGRLALCLVLMSEVEEARA